MRSHIGLALLALGLFLSGTNAFVIAGLLPDIAEALGTTEAAVGYSVTWYAAVLAVAAPVVSITLTRVPRTALLSGGLLLMAAGTATTLVADSIAVFTLGRCVAALGGAALVPTAMSVATTLVPAHRRGAALAAVALGFTLATAVGAPAGTWLGGLGSWRTPFAVVTAAAVALAVALALTVRRAPRPRSATVGQRLAVLRDRRVLLALGATMLLTSGFNVVYVFAASITAPATDGDPTRLAALLLVLGLGGIIGNLLAGPAIDRFGSSRVLVVTVLLQAAALVVLPLVTDQLTTVAAVFLVWGAGALAAPVALQHRLASVDPQTAPEALSWFASAQYLGIALAPVTAAVATSAAGVRWTPWLSAAVLLLAGVLAILGRDRARGAAPVEPAEPTGPAPAPIHALTP